MNKLEKLINKLDSYHNLKGKYVIESIYKEYEDCYYITFTTLRKSNILKKRWDSYSTLSKSLKNKIENIFADELEKALLVNGFKKLEDNG